MVFSSLTFLFRFLPIFLIVYYIFPKKYRNICLFGGSIIFYACGEPFYVFLILCSLIYNYSIAFLMDKYIYKKGTKRLILLFALIIDFGLLFFFKYTDFFIRNINSLYQLITNTHTEYFSLLNVGLPLGISFYTFQIVSYVLDIYYRKYPCENNLLHLGVYLCMFPQLIAGPIITYPQLQNEIKNRTYTKEQFENGLQIFILGLGSKVILANRIGILWHSIQTIGYDSLTMPLAWLGAFAFSFQLYFDFYGYSLMALGLGKMLGFTIPNNFDHPYLSLTLSDFFRRWHITLGKWFKEYIYIPLGGNRKGTIKTICNLLIVWFLTGFWHGASWNFILWGMSICLLIIIEKYTYGKYLKKFKVLGFIYMIFLVPLSWMIFAITDISDIAIYFTKMFSFTLDNSILNINNFISYLKSYGLLILCCFFCSTYLPDKLFHQYRKKPLGIITISLVFWISVYYLANSINNPFLYFRF